MTLDDPSNWKPEGEVLEPPSPAFERPPATGDRRPAGDDPSSTPGRRLPMLGLRRLLLSRRPGLLSGAGSGRLARALFRPPSGGALPEGRGGVVPFLGRVALFEGLSRIDLQRLARIVHEREYGDGEYISREGRPAAALFILRKGRVEVTRRGRDGAEVTLATLEPPAFFDEEAAVGRDTIRWFSTRARGPVSVLALGRADLDALCESFPPGANRVLMRLASILSMRHQSLLDALFAPDSLEGDGGKP